MLAVIVWIALVVWLGLVIWSLSVVRAAAERAVRSVYEVAALKLISPDFYGQRVSANFTGNEACPS